MGNCELPYFEKGINVYSLMLFNIFLFISFLFSFSKYQVTHGSFETDICLGLFSIKQIVNIYHSFFSLGNALDTQELLYSTLGT